MYINQKCQILERTVKELHMKKVAQLLSMNVTEIQTAICASRIVDTNEKEAEICKNDKFVALFCFLITSSSYRTFPSLVLLIKSTTMVQLFTSVIILPRVVLHFHICYLL